MMRLFKFTNVKLKKQLLLLIIIAIVMMLVGQLFFYFRFQELTKERANVYFLNMAGQVKTKIDSTLEDIKNIAFKTSYSMNIQKYLIEDDPSLKYKNMDYAIDTLDFICTSNNNILNIKIIERYGKVIKSGSNDMTDIYLMVEKEYKLEGNNYKKPFFTHCFLQVNSLNYYYAYIYPIFSTDSNKISSEENAGVCYILCKTEILKQSSENSSFSPNSVFSVIDINNTVIASNIKDFIGTDINSQVKGYSQKQDENNEITYNDKKYLYQETNIADTGWKIVNMALLDELVKDMKPLMNMEIIILVVTVIMLLIVGSIFIGNITYPVEDMISNMEKIGNDNIKQRLIVPGNNEIGRIAYKINEMLESIEGMTEKIFYNQEIIYQAELSKKQAELSFFQNQINPHFLYNTLECIRSMALDCHELNIVIISTAMAKIFRYNVKSSDVVTIKDEVDCIKDYFKIISIRFQGRFEIDILMDDKLMNCKIIKMILQPIVENAVYHGLEKKASEGSVIIKGFLYNDSDMVIEIEDNGRGFDDASLKELNNLLNTNETIHEGNEKNGVGLVNINRRLKLCYGDKYGLSIDSQYNVGSKVTIKIPMVT